VASERYRHDKIRIAYLSTISAAIPWDDHSRFSEAARQDPVRDHAIALSPSDGSDSRRRIEAAMDRFVNAHDMDDAAAARMMRDLEIDIAIDLNGLTRRHRHGILAQAGAVQVNYLAIPAPRRRHSSIYHRRSIVIPEKNRVFYSEKVAYLPNAYLPYDRHRKSPRKNPAARKQGCRKPVRVCLFQQSLQTDPDIFAIWLRLSRAWTAACCGWEHPAPREEQYASCGRQAQGVDPNVWCCAVHRSTPDFLARHRLADLFLDTCPLQRPFHGRRCALDGVPL